MSVASAYSAGTDRIVAGQQDAIFRPRNTARGRRLVVLLHGVIQTAFDWNDPTKPSQYAFSWAMAAAGITMLSIYADGSSWGNDAALTDIEAARAWASTVGCATDKLVLIGASMGAMNMWNYARANPSKVAALIGIMPCCDLDDLRDNNRGGLQAGINTAWGMPGGSTSSGNPLPARANPTADANAALIAGSGAAIKMYYSTADTVVLPSTVTTLGTKLGVTPTVISGSVDHSDALFGLVSTSGVIAALLAAGA